MTVINPTFARAQELSKYGFLGSVGNFLSNPLVLQMMSAAGADLMGRTGGKNLNAAVQQNVSARNYHKILSKMLGGEIPEGGSYTVKHDPEGSTHTFKVPGSEGANDLQKTTPAGVSWTGDKPITVEDIPVQTAGVGLGGVKSITPAPAPVAAPQVAATPAGASGFVGDQIGGMPREIWERVVGGPINPFAGGQLNLSPSDLAGLTPEMISDVVRLKMSQDEIGNRRISELADMAYKGKLMQYYDSQIAENANQSAVARANAARLAAKDEFDAGIAQSDLDRKWYEALTKDEQTTNMKDWQQARLENPNLKFTDYMATVREPEAQTLYRAAVADKSWNPSKDGGIWNFIKQRAEAGRTIVGTEALVDRKIKLAAVEARTQLKDPTQLSNNIAKELSSEATKNALLMASLDKEEGPKQVGLIKARAAVKVIQEMITAGGGELAGDTRWAQDGKTMIWTVKWPDGTTEEIRHAVR